MAQTPQAPLAESKPRNWRDDQKKGYVAHFDPETGQFDGPSDAFVWFGLPYQGSPWSDEKIGMDGKPFKVSSYIDPDKLSQALGSTAVEWVEWDTETQCNVYRRLA